MHAEMFVFSTNEFSTYFLSFPGKERLIASPRIPTFIFHYISYLYHLLLIHLVSQSSISVTARAICSDVQPLAD